MPSCSVSNCTDACAGYAAIGSVQRSIWRPSTARSCCAKNLRPQRRQAGRVDRRGAGRLGGGRHARHRDGPGAAKPRHLPAVRTLPAIRRAGGRPSRRRVGPWRPEAREYRGNPRRQPAADRLRRPVPPLHAGAHLRRTGHTHLPAPRPHGRKLRPLARPLPRRPDLRTTTGLGARPRPARPPLGPGRIPHPPLPAL